MQTFIVSVHPRKKISKCKVSDFGLRLSKAAREQFFAHDFSDEEKVGYIAISLCLEANAEPLDIQLRPSFWRSCRHMDHEEIGVWLTKNNVLEEKGWPPGKPPKFSMRKCAKGVFEIVSSSL